MANSGIEERGRSLEEAFFKKQHAEQLEKLRLKQEHEETRRALVEASGIDDDPDLIDRLVAIGIHAETLAALTLIPLVEVAWADGHVDERERKAILKAAESSKVEPGSPSHELLLIWTQDRPAPEMMTSWKDYIRALCAELSAEQKQHLEERIVGRARTVAEAAGGFLGFGAKVSAAEEAVLQELQQTFRAGT